MYGVLAHGSTTFLTEHFSPTFGLLAPAYRLLPFPELLAVLQPVFILTAGAGLYRLTQRLVAAHGLSPGYGLLPALVLTAYLFNYSNVAATVDVLYGFHHDSMIPPLLVWTVVCVVEARWRAVLVLFILFQGDEGEPAHHHIRGARLLLCLQLGRAEEESRDRTAPLRSVFRGLLLDGV
jgi:uncharacterized membrane protein